MGNIKIRQGVFDTKLEQEHASVVAGFPSPAGNYRHDSLVFNRDYIRHPEASFYGDDGARHVHDARRTFVSCSLAMGIPPTSSDEMYWAQRI